MLFVVCRVLCIVCCVLCVVGGGCWALGVGCCVLCVVCCMLCVVCWVLGVGCWAMSVGCWVLCRVSCVVCCVLCVACCVLRRLLSAAHIQTAVSRCARLLTLLYPTIHCYRVLEIGLGRVLLAVENRRFVGMLKAFCATKTKACTGARGEGCLLYTSPSPRD